MEGSVRKICMQNKDSCVDKALLIIAHEDAIEIFTPDRPYRLYTGSKNDKKLWLTSLKETIYNLLLKQDKCAESAVKDISE